MTVHEGGLRSEATPSASVATNSTDLGLLCAARDDALRTVEIALAAIERIDHAALQAMRAELMQRLQETRQLLSRPAALLLADQDLLRTSWVELQQALRDIQRMQADVDHFIAAEQPAT